MNKNENISSSVGSSTLTGQQSSTAGRFGVTVGSLIAGRYEVLSKLGHGGMGAVYKVRDCALEGEVVALKLLYPQYILDETVLARFRNEVLVARKLTHENVTKIYDFGEGEEEGIAYLTMEYVEGKSLGEYIHAPENEYLEQEQIFSIFLAVIAGIEHAHSHGVIHRDLKPDNILISSDGKVKITDFGLARSLKLDKGYTQTGEAVGTPYYMSPEQFRGGDVDQRSDVYALAIIAFECACRQRPFREETYLQLAAQHIRAPIPDLCREYPGIPEWYEEFVHICGEKEPEDRFQSMAEAREFFQANLEHPSVNRRESVLASVLKAGKSHSRQRRKRQSLSKPKHKTKTQHLLLAIFTFVFLITGVEIFRGKGVLNQNAAALLLRTEAAYDINLGLFKRFLGSEIVADRDHLLRAIEAKDLGRVKILLKAGVSADLQLEGGQSALFSALVNRQRELAMTLLEYGADATILGPEGVSPVMLAAEQADPALLENILARLGGDSAFYEVSNVDDHGVSALMRAVAGENLEIIDILLRAGASCEGRDSLGYNALILAVHKQNTQLLKLIAESGVGLDQQDHLGQTALMHATMLANSDIVNALVMAGADYKLTDTRGRTAFLHATKENRKFLDDAVEGLKRHKEYIKQNPEKAEPIISWSNSSELPKTTLKMIGKPRANYVFNNLRGGNKVSISEIKVELQNVGEETAEEIEVIVTIPGGTRLKIFGPRTLARKKKVTWTWTGLADVTRFYSKDKSSVSATVSCHNCR